MNKVMKGKPSHPHDVHKTDFQIVDAISRTIGAVARKDAYFRGERSTRRGICIPLNNIKRI